MRSTYVFCDFKYTDLFLDYKTLFFCKKIHIYEFNTSLLRCIVINFFCTLIGKRVYFHRFKFDDHTINGMNPYIHCRSIASEILFDSLKCFEHYTLDNYIEFLYARTNQLKLEELCRRLLFADLVFSEHESNVSFVISCDRIACKLYNNSGYKLIDPSINIRYKVDLFPLREIFSMTRKLVFTAYNAIKITIKNLFFPISPLKNDTSTKNLILTYDSILDTIGTRSINSLTLTSSTFFSDGNCFSFVNLNKTPDKCNKDNVYNISDFQNRLTLLLLCKIPKYWLICIKSCRNCTNRLDLRFNLFLFSLVLDLLESFSLINYFTNLESVYFYDDHFFIRGLKLLSLLSDSYKLKFHQVQYSTLSKANLIMLNPVDYLHYFDAHFLNSFLSPSLPRPILVKVKYSFALPEQPTNSTKNNVADNSFLIGYLDESIQFNDKFACISYESELAHFEALASFVLSKSNTYLCFKPQFHRNSPSVIFKRSSYLKLLMEQNRLIEYYDNPDPGNTRNRILPSYAFQNVDLCIGSCFGGTAPYECAISNIRTVLIHANKSDTPFNNYPFAGTVLFPDINVLIRTLSTFQNNDQLLKSNLGKWYS